MQQKAKRITSEVTRGPFAGGSDVLPQANVVAVHSVRQGVANFTDLDYSVEGNVIHWDGLRLQPSPGSAYQVNYDFIEDV